MKTANIRTLRAHLSRYLGAVKKGETVEIRERDTPIARLVPIDAKSKARRRKIPQRLLDLERRGVITIGTMEPPRWILEEGPLGPAGAGVLEALLEERRTGR